MGPLWPGRRPRPCLAVGDPIRYEAHGYPQIDSLTACGRQVAATLVTRSLDRVRCPECIGQNLDDAGKVTGGAP